MNPTRTERDSMISDRFRNLMWAGVPLLAATLWMGCQSAAADKKGPGACRYEDKSIDKSCNSVADCAMVEEVTDCCRTTIHIGVSAAGKAQFKSKPQKD